MRVKNALKSLSFVAVGLAVVSCNNSRDYDGVSRGTGWDVDEEYKTDYDGQITGPGLVFIDGGSFTMGRVQDDVMHDWNNSPTQQHVQSFYMDETEVTNLMYLEYLDYLKEVYPPAEEKYSAIYLGAVPDTMVWANRLGYNEPLTNNYLRHPSYQDYPVVGVSWIQATEYSQWRTDRVNEKILAEEGYTGEDARFKVEAGKTFNTATYLNAPTLTYGSDDKMLSGGDTSQDIVDDNQSNEPEENDKAKFARRKDGIVLPAYRLPTEAEWEYAALALTGIREYNSYRGRKKYPWNGQYIRSGKRGKKGDILANFKLGDGDYGGIAGWTVDGAAITNEIKSYPPNAFGLYDMAGNVAEWVADVYRPIVDDNYNDFNYYRGNVYMKNAINPDGTVTIVTADSIQYDTLSDGDVVARVLPGEIKQVPVGEKETFLRTQFSTSDNRDFRDGDKRSSRFYYQDELTGTKRMYNSPENTIGVDSTGTLIRQYDESNDRTTLIDDEVRVYKGGSWKDIAYWLDPATRRYLPQDMATNYIGFRCAMSRVGGSADKKGNTARD
ncbi:MAG TPA: gliding motility lipoprotein GldJ [Flavobacteriaceae bacterium]|nr:gliding motility lipoprotein GldJ [Flavobacteriaceae bacterium]